MLPLASILLLTTKHCPWGSQKLLCYVSKMVLFFLLVFWRERHKEHRHSASWYPSCKIGITVASTFQKPYEDAPGLLKSGWGLKLADMQHPVSTIQKQMRSVSQKLSFCVAVWVHAACTLTAVQRWNHHPGPRLLQEWRGELSYSNWVTYIGKKSMITWGKKLLPCLGFFNILLCTKLIVTT